MQASLGGFNVAQARSAAPSETARALLAGADRVKNLLQNLRDAVAGSRPLQQLNPVIKVDLDRRDHCVQDG
jgi:hypothetical protein